jgi:hypothetical protein
MLITFEDMLAVDVCFFEFENFTIKKLNLF